MLWSAREGWPLGQQNLRFHAIWLLLHVGSFHRLAARHFRRLHSSLLLLHSPGFDLSRPASGDYFPSINSPIYTMTFWHLHIVRPPYGHVLSVSYELVAFPLEPAISMVRNPDPVSDSVTTKKAE